MKVYFDIITNHTADIIDYAEKSYSYVPTDEAPYLTADGEPIDLAAVAGDSDFPELDAATSFPSHSGDRAGERSTARCPHG